MEAKKAMKEKSAGMPMDMGNVKYWLENQIVLTFLSKLDSSVVGPERIIESLKLDRLNLTLNKGPVPDKGSYNLRPFDDTDVPGPHFPTPDPLDREQESGEIADRKSGDLLGKTIEAAGEGIEKVGEKIEDLGNEIHGHEIHDEANEISSGSVLSSRVGKYFFSLPPGQGTLVLSFFHVKRVDQSLQDSTPGLVDLLNSTRDDYSTPDAKFIASMPNWLNGGTNGPNFVTHGCPTMPSIQVDKPCNQWKYSLPRQFSLPKNGTGREVTVFVLDTLPKISDITKAATEPGSNNSLLSSMVHNMVSVASNGTVFPPGSVRATPPAIKVNYNILPDALDVVSPVQPATGKDIYGRLVGFPMADHGLFVAGIIRDLASDAHIECIRVLNDYGVGNTTVLIDAWNTLYNRLGQQGDLRGQHVVINMSLVATPADEELAQFGYTVDSIKPARLALLMIMELLAARGVVFAASAGNDSDLKDTPPMNPDGLRLGPRYPSAFAYSGVSDTGLAAMIPVGAVDALGNPAAYSNYPGSCGIATYGGKRPEPDPQTPGANVTKIKGDIDAPRGVYSSILYPALALEDTEPFHSSSPFNYPELQRNGSSTWAYWAGTSFASPVISAIAACVLEKWQSTDPSVRDIIISAAKLQASQSSTKWDRLEPNNETIPGPLILVTQNCQDDNPLQ
jgi:subtilisin family serine protease